MRQTYNVRCPHHLLQSFLLVTIFIGETAMAVKYYNSFAGPYIFVIDKQYDCPLGEDGYDGSITHNLRYSHFNPYKRNEPQIVWGNETRALPLNDTYWMLVNASAWRNNEWKPNWLIMRTPTKGCTNTRRNDPHWFHRIGGVVINGTCMMPAGTFDIGSDPIPYLRPDRYPVLPYGRYRFRTTYGIGSGRPIPYCCDAELDLIPL